MKALQGLLALLVFLAGAFLSSWVSEELRGRLERLPYLFIRLAARRLPPHLRDDLAQEWTAELPVILQDTDGLPITRLYRGIRYALGLLRAAPTIGRTLTDAPSSLHAISVRRCAMAGTLGVLSGITMVLAAAVVGAVTDLGATGYAWAVGGHMVGVTPHIGGVAVDVGAALNAIGFVATLAAARSYGVASGTTAGVGAVLGTYGVVIGGLTAIPEHGYRLAATLATTVFDGLVGVATAALTTTVVVRIALR